MFKPSLAWLEADGTTAISSIKSVHPEIDAILKIINNYRCTQHPERTLCFNHLEHHPEVRLKHP
jgi:hypothetical protein